MPKDQTRRHSAPARIDPRLHAALTDLHAFVLMLDAERQRVLRQVDQLAESAGGSSQRSCLKRQYREISEELEALRSAIATLRATANPDGDQL